MRGGSRRSWIWTASVAVTSALACDLAPTAVDEPLAAGVSLAMAQARVDVCHLTGTGEYEKITIAEPAFDTHVDHGDVAAGTAGLDESCQPLPDCATQLWGICFQGEPQDLDPELIFNDTDAFNWCSQQSGLACDLGECTQRVRVIAGLAEGCEDDICLPAP